MNRIDKVIHTHTLTHTQQNIQIITNQQQHQQQEQQ